MQARALPTCPVGSTIRKLKSAKNLFMAVVVAMPIGLPQKPTVSEHALGKVC